MLTIKLPLTREQFEANLNFIMQCTREAALPAKSHENVAAILNDLVSHIQPDPEATAPPKPIEVIKDKERKKAKQQHT